MLSESVERVLHQIAKNEGFVDYKIETAAGSNHGDNFMSVMNAVTISGTKDSNDHIQELHLLCKLPSSNEVRNKNFRSSVIFNRELFVYSEVFPHLAAFQRERGLNDADAFLSYPKVYACDIDKENDKFILVMQDLRGNKFEMWAKEKVIPFEHLSLVLRQLGKFHAISFAMKDQQPNQFKQYEELVDAWGPMCIHGKFGGVIKKSLESAAKALNNPEHKEFMQHFLETYPQTYDDLLIGEISKEFAVIGHGDLWNNNLLFQYADDDKQQVKAVSIVDWQITRYCAPVLDVLSIILSSSDKQFRQQHYDALLKAYYSSLCENIRKLGSDPDKLYTWDDFQNQLRKFIGYGLLFALLIIQLRMAGANDIGNVDDFAERIERGENIDLVNITDEQTQKEYEILVNDVVADLFDYGYLNVQ